LKDEKLKKIVEDIVIGKSPGFRMDDNGILWFGKRLCVPEDQGRQFFVKLMSQLILFILVVLRCI
jgi:hypothetical protein